jgi:hypothetical protein
MASYTTYQTLVPEIKQYCHGAPDIMLRTHIRNAAILFCERTMVLKKTPSSFYLTEDVHTYTLKYSGDRYVAIDIKDAQLGEGSNGTSLRVTTEHMMDVSINKWTTREANEPSAIFLADDVNTVRVYPIPNQDSTDEMFVNTVVKPRRNQTEMDSFLYEKWEEQIQAGALAALLAMHQASWFNARLSAAFSQEFKRGIMRARKNTLSGYGDEPGEVTPRNYSGVSHQRGGGFYTWV